MLKRAKEVILAEARALNVLAQKLDRHICIAADLILSTQGLVVVSGVGKSQIIGEKISATLASTGTPSITLDPTDAMHGDLGRLRRTDILLVLSNSGETEELKRLVHSARGIKSTIIAVTGNSHSTIAATADIALDIGNAPEACPFNLTPTCSTTAMMALGDALAMIVLEKRGFTRMDFGRLHPSGSLGRRLMRVHDVMLSGDKMPVVPPETPIGLALAAMTMAPGRAGAVLIVDKNLNLKGILTASGLQALVRIEGIKMFAEPVEKAMNTRPVTVMAEWLVDDVLYKFAAPPEDQLPVIDDKGALVGLLDLASLTDAASPNLPRPPEPHLSVA